IQGPIRSDVPAIVEIGVTITEMHPNLMFGYALTNEAGTCVYWTSTHDADERLHPKLGRGPAVLASAIPCRLLNQGMFRLDLLSAIHSQQWLINPNDTHCAIFLRVSGTSQSGYLRDAWPG